MLRNHGQHRFGRNGMAGSGFNMVTKGGKAPSKAAAKKKAPKKEEPIEVAEAEVVEECVEEGLLARNPARSTALRDLWFDDISKIVDKADISEKDKKEFLFLNLTNSLLDMVIDIVPGEVAKIIAENMDDFLAIAIVNKENKVNLLQMFRDDFVASKGTDFEDEDQLMAALTAYEDEWWNGKRKDLKGKSPNQALIGMAEKYDLK
ncbi:MAG: hypothetical protein WCK39_09830 [Methanomassiliicoccales archaeon]